MVNRRQVRLQGPIEVSRAGRTPAGSLQHRWRLQPAQHIGGQRRAVRAVCNLWPPQGIAGGSVRSTLGLMTVVNRASSSRWRRVSEGRRWFGCARLTPPSAADGQDEDEQAVCLTRPEIPSPRPVRPAPDFTSDGAGVSAPKREPLFSSQPFIPAGFRPIKAGSAGSAIRARAWSPP